MLGVVAVGGSTALAVLGALGSLIGVADGGIAVLRRLARRSVAGPVGDTARPEEGSS